TMQVRPASKVERQDVTLSRVRTANSRSLTAIPRRRISRRMCALLEAIWTLVIGGRQESRTGFVLPGAPGARPTLQLADLPGTSQARNACGDPKRRTR